nr:unnamed protein product [Spirometra erinaceieuropaei]
MQYPPLLLCLLVSLKTTAVMGFGDGYAEESVGGLIVDPKDRAERERIDAKPVLHPLQVARGPHGPEHILQ